MMLASPTQPQLRLLGSQLGWLKPARRSEGSDPRKSVHISEQPFYDFKTSPRPNSTSAPQCVSCLLLSWGTVSGALKACTYSVLSPGRPALTPLLCLRSQVGRAPGSLCSPWLPQAPLPASVAPGDVQPLSGALGADRKGRNTGRDYLASLHPSTACSGVGTHCWAFDFPIH